MLVHVLLFAHYADQLGTSGFAIELPRGATVGEAVTAVRQRSGAEGLRGTPLTAVNERYARSEHPLADGDTLALLPPVAGG